MRPDQWTKNLVLFAGLVFAGGLGGTLIVTAVCADPAFASAATDGDAQLAATATGTAVAAGNIDAYALTDSDNVKVEEPGMLSTKPVSTSAN